MREEGRESRPVGGQEEEEPRIWNLQMALAPQARKATLQTAGRPSADSMRTDFSDCLFSTRSRKQDAQGESTCQR